MTTADECGLDKPELSFGGNVGRGRIQFIKKTG
jgi:hypothetical protein